MSQENVERVRSIVEPFAGVDATEFDLDSPAIREMLERDYSPDAELWTLASGFGSGVREYYRGRDDLIRYFREWLEPFSEYRAEALDYIEAGRCVLVPSRQWGIGAESGARVELELTTLYELRDGQIARMVQYDTTQEALEAAGLRK
jgi:ketosteroid isomerase-like protein